MLLKNPQTRFEEIYSIYQEAFPDSERRTKEGQRKVFENPLYRIRVLEEDGKILAFLGYWELESCLFLEHLATEKECRGGGYGKRLIEEVTGETKQPVFLEIEPVTEKNPMTGRRENFYKRLGLYTNSFAYLQMPLKPEDAPVPLWVMSYGKPVTEEKFYPFKKEIYKVVYNVQ